MRNAWRWSRSISTQFGAASLNQLASRQNGQRDLLPVGGGVHTHSAPIVQDEYKNGPPAWERAALDRIGKAIQEAVGALVDARIGTGTGVVYIGHNRLRVNADGSVSWFERNITRIPTAPVDPTVSVIRVDRMDGSALAILTQYACHPVVFGSDNLQYSADFPGVMNRVVEEKIGGHPLSFFLQGAPGDINPYYAVTPIEENAAKWRDWTGERLGREAARVAAGIHTETTAEPSIEFAEESMTVRLRWNEDKFRAALLKFLGPQGMEVYGATVKPEFQLPPRDRSHQQENCT